MPYRNKTYVAFDADNDMSYYRTLQMWRSNDNIDFDFYDAHEINNLRATSSEDTIKQKLRERLNNSRVLIILVGEYTKNLYKYVRWELEISIKLDLPIIVANLNKTNSIDYTYCPPIIKEELAIHGPFNLEFLKKAVRDWPDSYKKRKAENKSGCFYYDEFD